MERPLPRPSIMAVLTSSILFQSLFLWNDLFNQMGCISVYEGIRSFNPCFYGTTSSTVGLRVGGRLTISVSILVFMERPLQQRIMTTGKRMGKSFNPCFYGTTSSTLFHYLLISILHSVSILVFMERPLQQCF